MAGETDLHKKLKKEACRWLLRMGYRCIAAEVRLPPLGIIDAVGTGVFRPYQNYLAIPRSFRRFASSSARPRAEISCAIAPTMDNWNSA